MHLHVWAQVLAVQLKQLYVEGEEWIEHLKDQVLEEDAQVKLASTYGSLRFTQLMALAGDMHSVGITSEHALSDVQSSQLYLENEELIEHLIDQGQEEDAKVKVAGSYATSRFTQLVALARKFRLAYWRSPSYNLTRMLMTLLICLFYGTVFWGRGRMPKEGQRCACPCKT